MATWVGSLLCVPASASPTSGSAADSACWLAKAPASTGLRVGPSACRAGYGPTLHNDHIVSGLFLCSAGPAERSSLRLHKGFPAQVPDRHCVWGRGWGTGVGLEPVHSDAQGLAGRFDQGGNGCRRTTRGRAAVRSAAKRPASGRRQRTTTGRHRSAPSHTSPIAAWMRRSGRPGRRKQIGEPLRV